LKKANLVPLLEKCWKLEIEFVQRLHIYNDHSKFNFLDKKHGWNKDVYSKKSGRIHSRENFLAST
jgi:hypothetical protein